MKNFLSVLIILTLSMGCTVCNASNLETVENNPEIHEKVDVNTYVANMLRRRMIDPREDRVLIERPLDERNYVRYIRRADNGELETFYIKGRLTSASDDESFSNETDGSFNIYDVI